MSLEPQIDLWKGIPVWVRAACVLGAPTIAAGYLIWLVSGSLATDVRAMRSDLIHHNQATAVLIDKINEDRTVQSGRLEVLIRLLQTQCVNAATDVMQRRDCLNAGAR